MKWFQFIYAYVRIMAVVAVLLVIYLAAHILGWVR